MLLTRTELMVPKDSVAVNGVSLTLVNVSQERFSVALIPTTLSEKILETLAAGDTVNIEADVIGKYVVTFLWRMIGTRHEDTNLPCKRTHHCIISGKNCGVIGESHSGEAYSG